ncbi:flagellar hook assembly protein FlgD [Virgibacillus sp. FSP13]
MTKIDPSLYLHNQPDARTPSPDLGKDEFMKILMTQLQNQDPTNPMDDREFISQMATFSSLEQMMNMTNSIDKLVQNQMESPVVKYSHMIGKEVSYQAYDEETGEKLDVETSKVAAVSQQDGWAILELENGEKIYADSIIQVGDPEAEVDTDNTEEKVVGPEPSEGSE